MKPAILLITLALVAWSPQSRTEEAEIAILPPSEAEVLAKQCSRGDPPQFEGTWVPQAEQVAFLKTRLPNLIGMEPTGCCLPGASITTLSGIKIQVVGLVLAESKTRVLYLNAVSELSADDPWRTKAFVICDGGALFWGVVFDPATGAFSGLAFNGIG